MLNMGHVELHWYLRTESVPVIVHSFSHNVQPIVKVNALWLEPDPRRSQIIKFGLFFYGLCYTYIYNKKHA